MVVLAAFGKSGYGYAAHNLALSLRHHGYKGQIYLYAQRETLDAINPALFDNIIFLEEHEYTYRGRFAPGYGKINVIAKLPFEENLFIDVDSLCLQPIEPLIETLKHKDFSTIWMGEGYYKQDISYDPWANHEYAWSYFDLPYDRKWTTTQTSMVWIRKNEKTQQIVRDLQYYYEKGYSPSGLKEAWARQYIPDELIFSGVIARHYLDIKMGIEPVFFGVINNPDRSLQRHEIEKKYYFLSMLGGAANKSLTLPKFQEWYSAMGRVISKTHNIPFFDHKYVMIDKLLNA